MQDAIHHAGFFSVKGRGNTVGAKVEQFLQIMNFIFGASYSLVF